MKINLLFVCVENANRSQMAEAFAKIHGGDDVFAMSAGSKGGGKINPKAVKAMAELNYDMSEHKSLSVNDVPTDIEFDAVVSMGCGDACPHVPAKRRIEWNITDPRDLPESEYNTVRDEVEQNVLQLLDELKVKSHE